LGRVAFFTLFAFPTLLSAQASQQTQRPQNWVDQTIQQETFARPPQEILDAVMAPRHNNVTISNLSPDKAWALRLVGDGPVRMDIFSKPFHDLGGEFIDFKANRDRSLTISSSVGIEIISVSDGTRRAIQTPPGARVSNATWSPDGRSVAYFAHTDDATHIWIADAATGRSRQLTRTPVLATFVQSFDFVGDGRKIAVVVPPDGRSPMPVEPAVPPGPHIKVAEEKDKNRLRTYASLLATPYQQDLLEWHGTGQLALIDVQSRAVTKLGAPAMIRSIDVAPSGLHARVTRMVRPFSYVVPVANFGTIEEVWDASGKVLVELNKRELNLGVQADNPVAAPGAGGAAAQQTGRREISWRPDGQGLTFLEQEPLPPGQRDTVSDEEPTGGRGGGQGGPRRRDRVMQWLPPFDSSAASLKTVYSQDARMTGHRWSPDMQVLFFTESQGQNRMEIAVYPAQPNQKYTLARYRAEDIYANPGTMVLTRGGGGGGRGGGAGGFGGGGGGGGTVQLSSDGSSVYFQGTQYDRNPLEVAPKPFVDKVNIRTGAKTRVFEGNNNGVSENVSAVLDADATRFIISREGPKQVGQQFLRAGGREVQLTQNVDLMPDLTNTRKESFVVERPDGFKFKVNVMLPVGFRDGAAKPPAMFWFYPREYAGQEEYDRGARTFNKNSFQSFGIASIHFLARLGYTIVEPDAPIVGQTGEMNNNYEHDLRNNLSAVIDELDRRGFADRTRIGLGGHSYGAFSTVNAMVHTPFFKAGIAGDGAYNRTLTPLGFQSERRDFWQARDVYLSMSPFVYANNLTGSLLLYHGLHDQNVGTDPVNSPRLFHALNGLGKTVSMYLYPYEDHGPATLETRLDLWARWTAWLDKYVKNPQKAETKVTTEDKPISGN
jgi:dipeptidyl aminopeptidase/acylaminoacyl peptidase